MLLIYLFTYFFTFLFFWRKILRVQLDEFSHKYTHTPVTTRHLDQDRKLSQHPEAPLVPNPSLCLPHLLPPRGNYYYDLYHHRLVLLVNEPYINRIVQYIPFCIWLVLFNISFMRFIRGAVCSSNSLSFIVMDYLSLRWSTPLYGYPEVHSTILLFIGICVVLVFCCYE